MTIVLLVIVLGLSITQGLGRVIKGMRGSRGMNTDIRMSAAAVLGGGVPALEKDYNIYWVYKS